MVDDPHPPIKKVQFVQFSDASTESAPFIYFDEVLTAGVHQSNVRIELGAGTVIPTAGRSGENSSCHNGTLTM